MNYCKLKIGNRGSGKSVSLERELWELFLSTAIILFDRPGKLARSLTGRAAAARKEEHVVYDTAKPLNGKNLGWPFFERSSLTDPIERKNEEELLDEELHLALSSRRDVKTPVSNPLIHKYTKYGIRVFRSLPQIPPANLLPKLYRKDDPVGQWMVQNCADREAAQVFIDAAFRSARDNGRQWESDIGPAGRNMDAFESTAVWIHDRGRFDWDQALREKKQVYVDLSGVTAEAARTLTILAYTKIIHCCRRHLGQTGKPLPVLIVLEEAGALDLVTPVILTAMQELRAAGVTVWVVSQTLFDFKTEVMESLLSLCDIHDFFRINSGIERAAQDLAYATWDPHKVHHTRDVVYTAGYEKVETKSVTRGDGGDRTTEGATFRPIQDIRVEETYYTPQQHEADFREKLTNLQTFQRFIRDHQGVRRETVPPLPTPWFLGDEYLPKYGMTAGERNTQLAIDRIRSRAYFTQAPQWTPPTATARTERRDATGELIGD